MLELIQWMNNNEGFLMSIITFVYVLATILICFFNAKSASASRKQIVEAQKQQQQNVGLQLYGLRKETITRLSDKRINEIYWDIPLLYNQKIIDDYLQLTYKFGEEEKNKKDLETFETELTLIYPFTKGISGVRNNYIENNDQKVFEELITAVRQRCQQKEAINSIDLYEKLVQRTQEKHKEISNETVKLIQQMQNYIKESIA